MTKKLTSLSIVAFASIFLAGCTKQSNTPQTTNKTVSEASEFAKAIQSSKPTTCVMTKDNDKMEYFTRRSHSHNCGEGGSSQIRE